MIWGGINNVEPPYMLKITKTAGIPADVADEIRLLSSALGRGREERLRLRGDDIGVSLVAPEL